MSYVSLKELIAVKDSKNLSQFLNYKKIFPKVVHEITDFCCFAKTFYSENKGEQDIDGWFLGTDLQVVPDFDVLLFLDDFTLNIDLKHQTPVGNFEKISKKFKQQSRIFRILKKPVYNFVFIAETELLYYFDSQSETFSLYGFDELFKLIFNHKILLENAVSKLTPAEFLINPWKDKDDTINKRYWLSNDQQKIGDQIINHGIYGVTGEAGTGKTLIAIDVMIRMALNNRILFIVPGDVDLEKREWALHFENIQIVPAKNVTQMDLDQYQMILVDEAQRLFDTTRNALIVWANTNYTQKTIIFLFHVDQTLGPKDSGMLLENFIKTIEIDGKGSYFKLTSNMRSNAAITYFVRHSFNLKNSAPKKITTEEYRRHIKLKYFANNLDAKKWIDNQIQLGYVFLSPTGDKYKVASSDKFQDISTINTHHVIGGEMDNVVTYIDDFLQYTRQGRLVDKSNDYYFLDHEVYVNLTRARNKLALAIINNPDLYKAIIEVVYKLSD